MASLLRVCCLLTGVHNLHSRRLQREAELKAHALGLLCERIAGSESAQLAAAVAALESELEAARKAAAAAKKRKADAAASAEVGRGP